MSWIVTIIIIIIVGKLILNFIVASSPDKKKEETARIEANDLCYSCRKLPTEYGKTVEEILEILYTDPEKWLESGGEIGVVTILNKAIVLGDGCTGCGEKVIKKARALGLLNP